MPSAEPRATAPEAPNGIVRIRRVSLAAGLIAGVLAAAAGELTHQAFRPDLQYPANYDSLTGVEKTAIRGQVRFKARSADETKKAAAAFGLLGIALGATLGLAGGLAGGARRSSLQGAIVGAVAAGLAGAGLSMTFVPVFFDVSDSQTGVLLLLLTHWAIFAAIGVAGGFALGWALGDQKVLIRCMIGGILGSLVGTFVCEVINFLAFPLLRMYEPVPVKTLPRFVLVLGVAIAIAFGAGLAAKKRRRKPDASGPASL